MGLIQGLTGMTGGGEVENPNVGNVNKDYMGLIGGYQKGASKLLDTQEKLQPRYTAASLKNLFGTYTGTNGQPGVMELFSMLDPDSTKLMSRINDTANEGLDLGTSLDPDLARLFSQSTRAGQAARGLGYGPSDALEEGRTLTELGQNLRTQRQNFATQTATLNANRLAQLLGLGQPTTAAGAGAFLTPSSSMPLLSLPYEARVQTKIASAKNFSDLMKSSGEGFDSMAGVGMGMI